MDWKQEAETSALKEFSELSAKSTRELVKIVSEGEYGNSHQIWKVLALHGNLHEVGWVMFEALAKIKNDTQKVACAKALIELLNVSDLQTQPFHFLDEYEHQAKNLEELETALSTKIGHRK